MTPLAKLLGALLLCALFIAAVLAASALGEHMRCQRLAPGSQAFATYCVGGAR